MPGVRVSVIIDNFNYAAFLPDAIESALGQDHRSVEVVVVDDGSTDDSAAVLQRYQDDVRVIRKENGGQASAFNAGFAACTGELISLLDADDRWRPTKVRRMVEAAAAQPAGVMLQHRLQPVGDRLSLPAVPSPLLGGHLRRLSTRSGGWWPFAPASALTFRRDFLERVLPVPEAEFRICADAYLADAAPFFGDVVAVQEVLGDYRLHGDNGWAGLRARDDLDSTMRTYNQRWESRARTLNELLARHGCRERVTLDRHFYYQRHRLRLGERRGRTALSMLALSWPAERSPLGRLQNATSVWRRAGREAA